MTRLNRLFLVKFFLLMLFCWTSCNTDTAEEVSSPERPNIIYILADDLGYGDLSTFNENSKIKTTHLDRLAAEGMKFRDAHSSSSVCTPTRYSILTGRYNWRSTLKSGVLTGKSKALIPNDRLTVASLLQKNGYNTAFIGKWHLGWDWALTTDSLGGSGWNAKDFDNIDFTKPITNNPNDLGFDYAYGHAGSLDMAPYVYVENGKVTQVPDTVTANKNKYTWWREGPTSKDFVHEQVTPHFFEKTIQYVNQSTEKEPFFIYLALPSPHTPILPTPDWQGRSGLNPYADFVLMIDDYVGQLMTTLDKKGIADNTMIVFTSDNGCSPEANYKVLAEKGHNPSYVFRGHKADIYEGGHHVPFIVRWKNGIKAGAISDDLVCTTDFLATCADIVNYTLKDNEGEDSHSMMPIFTKQAAAPRKDVIHHSINGSFAIRKGDWKLIQSAGSAGWSFPTPSQVNKLDTFPPIQLYNLKNDIGEQVNLQAKESEKVKELRQLLSQQILDGRSTKGAKQENDAPLKGKWKQIDFVDK